jgi:hypothetical protein
MADQKTTALTAGVPISTDIVPYVSDPGGTPTTKKALVSELRGLVQQANTETGAVSTGTTTIPFDDTIPQITEGTEFMTVSITPTNAAHILEILVSVFVTSTSTPWLIVALFQDAIANALAVGATFNNLATAGAQITFRHRMVAGTTSAINFRVRIGPSSAATVTFNGQSGGRIFGGVAASSIRVQEMAA